MVLLIIFIILAAASPIIFLLVFSEIMAAKEGSKINDSSRKMSKNLGWIFFGIFCLLLIYSVLTDDTGNMHFREIFKFISFFFDFLK